jgi:hypothetical protein
MIDGRYKIHRFEKSTAEKEQRGYAEQRLKLAEKNVDFYEAIKWITVQNPSVCEFGRQLHGKQFPTTDPMWKRCLPPIHSGCTCFISPQMHDRVNNVERLSTYFEV